MEAMPNRQGAQRNASCTSEKEVMPTQKYSLPPFGLFKKEAKVDFVVDITACSCK